jgi:hypothetical protein
MGKSMNHLLKFNGNFLLKSIEMGCRINYFHTLIRVYDGSDDGYGAGFPGLANQSRKQHHLFS